MVTTAAPKIKKRLLGKSPMSLLSVKQGRIDYVFLLLLLLLLTMGMILLFSASFADAFQRYDNSYRFISRQAIFGIGGVVLMLFVSTINHRVYEKIIWPLYATAVGLLIFVLRFKKINGARRWIIIGESTTIQPSEIAKFALILLVAHIITLNYERMSTFRYGILPQVLFSIPIMGLILVEPHLSATIIVMCIVAVMLFVGGAKLRWFALLGVGIFIIGYILVNVVELSYVTERIAIWQNPYADPLDAGYQTIQSLYAIGSGGLMGQGLGGSTQKYGYLPELQNDYIFAVVCEELGFVGAVIIIFLFALLVWRGFLISTRCKDKFGSLVALGLTAQVGVQVIFNIMVITNTVPPTGVSLPFFSSGGTSLIMLLMQMGVILSISRQTEVEETAVSKAGALDSV